MIQGFSFCGNSFLPNLFPGTLTEQSALASRTEDNYWTLVYLNEAQLGSKPIFLVLILFKKKLGVLVIHLF
ncbi:MAG: hypothetical protein ACI9YL_001234 [Luteibaculaceae bacterium]|jgi:hypothetical protein